MTVLIPNPAVNRQSSPPDPARTLDTLATVAIIILTVGALYFAREILVPIAIAVLLSFVMSPSVQVLRGWGFNKAIAVATVVFLAFMVTVGIGFIVTKQITDLAADAPRYQAVVMQKVDFVRDKAANNSLLGKINAVVADFSKAPEDTKKEASKEAAKPATKSAPGAKQPESKQQESKQQESKATSKPKDPAAPTQVEIVEPPPGVLTILQKVAGSAASPIATVAFVALFIVFILMQREDLRNRFIRLVGGGDLNRTTLAMNEAAARLSRYFVAQMILNISFGIVVMIALTLIGVPSAVLWGIVAIFMRFIPYLGAIGAALFPLLMAAASSNGWAMVIETAILFAVLELLTGQVIEPLVYGSNTGISPIAVVLSATFWTWLWGPVGLVLSTPLTVCLVVMGRHVERFAFLPVILGDAPPLTPAETFYQRMLVGDPSEVIDHAEGYLKERALLDYCDEIAMKALLMAQIDVRRGALDEDRQAKICGMMRDLVDDLAELDHDDKEPEKEAAAAAIEEDTEPRESAEDSLPKTPVDPSWKRENSVICVAGRTALDEAAAHLLADLLGQREIGAHVEPAESLTTTELAHLTAAAPRLVILSFLDADLSVAQARFAVRRLRRRIPDVPVVAAFWMAEDDEARITSLCADVRCETCVSNLPQALRLCLERAAAPDVAEAADAA